MTFTRKLVFYYTKANAYFNAKYGWFNLSGKPMTDTKGNPIIFKK